MTVNNDAASDNGVLLPSGEAGIFPDAFSAMSDRLGFRDDESRESRFIEKLELQLRAHIRELNYSNERLQAEVEERKLAEEALRQAATTFESHEAILITDAQANIIRVNQAFSDITGYLPDEAMGKNPSFLSAGPHSHEAYLEMWRRLEEDGKWSGEIWGKRKDGQVFPKWMSTTAVKSKGGETCNYVAIFSDITSRKKAEEEIRYMAFYDVLTTLPNRRLFLDRLHIALSASARHHNYSAIMFIDLDNFKALNDTHGHDCGDLLLKEVADRIKSCVREIDTVARFGGDEFVVLIEAISEEQEEAQPRVRLVAEKIRAGLAQPYKLKEQDHRCSCSIGISLFHGNEEPMDMLLQHADIAMYQAKRSGRNAIGFYQAHPTAHVVLHRAQENGLGS